MVNLGSELPKKGKAKEILMRIGYVVISPFAYVALSFVALAKLILNGIWENKHIAQVSVKTQNFTDLSATPYEKLINQMTYLVNHKKIKDLYWMPHPKFKKRDQCGPFPANRVNFLEVNGKWGYVVLGPWLKEKKNFRNIDKNFGGNDFFNWLNNAQKPLEKKSFFASDNIFFMNCVDFVFLNLYHADLISKQKIAEIYRQQICNELEQKKMTFYGFNLNLFRELDNPLETPKQGDILIGFEKGQPCHLLFLSPKNPTSGSWQGVGLWNTQGLNPSCEDLTELQKNGSEINSPVTFKYCSLERALGHM
jgi:hypothetical protein